MALNRSITSLPSWVSVESDVDEDEDVESLDGGGPDGGGPCFSRVVRADWAVVMSPEVSAESTLEMNLPSGLEESALEGVRFSTLVR